MRVIVCGSRSWHNRVPIIDRLADLPSGTTVVTGYDPERDKPGGVDRIAYQEAQKLGLEVEVWPAAVFQSDKISAKVAPLVRNRHMAKLGADRCIAFWDGRSTGTAHMRDRALEHGIPVEMNYAQPGPHWEIIRP